ncbi:hypothetical protein AB0C28_17145 [Nonomuraea sp. NPDC048892]|uniref:hypothetical protein n=1 Tax=Nonomuraea sp. NPDC048892 TaxID=3154624 RepID=UPI003405894B
MEAVTRRWLERRHDVEKIDVHQLVEELLGPVRLDVEHRGGRPRREVRRLQQPEQPEQAPGRERVSPAAGPRDASPR